MRRFLKFLLHISKGHRKALSAILLIGILSVAVSLAFVWALKTVVDVATGDTGGSLLHFSVILVCLALFRVLLNVLDVRYTNITEVKVGNAIRQKVFSNLLYTKWIEANSLHSGDVLTRIIKDTDDIIKTMISTFPLLITSLLQLMGAFVILLIMDPALALILGVAMPTLLFFSKPYYVKMRDYTRQIKESESFITSMMEENLLNQLVVRTYERQESELHRLNTLQQELQGKVERKTTVSVWARFVSGIGFSGGYVTAFIWGAWGIAGKTITFGTLTAYLQLVNQIQRPLYELMRMFPAIISAQAASERLSFLSTLETEDIGEKQFLKGEVSLIIDDITYTYRNNENPVIKNFSLQACPGEMIAVMGETGAGKTTLLRLILSLIEPNKGEIVIQNARERVAVSPATRSNFVYVPQGNTLFSGTIRDNLLIGNPDANDEMLIKALETASATFVVRLPEGLNTVLGVGGTGVSEGQAQRIAIARSLLRPGQILLLDEATSALDTETERLFLHNLKKEIGNRVVLFITHQPEVAKYCDRVYKV
ncbi:MAG: ABC transporter ATP-binding protein [Bacteroidia bacterium]|nr:ABC transporter ATP-binding protein [Bacteroidia bacterium]